MSRAAVALIGWEERLRGMSYFCRVGHRTSLQSLNRDVLVSWRPSLDQDRLGVGQPSTTQSRVAGLSTARITNCGHGSANSGLRGGTVGPYTLPVYRGLRAVFTCVGNERGPRLPARNPRYQLGTKVPIQLAQCRFPGLAVFSAKILLYFFK